MYAGQTSESDAIALYPVLEQVVKVPETPRGESKSSDTEESVQNLGIPF